ncbi:MAG TPA: YihY/virulence factor BrkB family protein [Caulobacteraceae bacterium]
MTSRPDKRSSKPSRRPSALAAAAKSVRLAVGLGPWLVLAAGAIQRWRDREGERLDRLTPAEIDAREPGRGRCARAPWQIPPRGWKDILWRTYAEMNRGRLPALAGGVTFYLLLATFPAIAAFVSLFGLVTDVDTVERQFVQVSALFPSQAVNFLGDQMVRIAASRRAALSAAFLLSAAVSVWSAKSGVQALFDAVNIAYNETEKRAFLPRVLLTYGATLVAVLVIVAAACASATAPDVLRRLGFADIAALWDPLRWVGILTGATATFTVVYRLAPSRRPARWRWLIPGGLFAAVAWMVGSLAFSRYLDAFGHLGVTYGSLSTLIGFMLWLWLSVLIVLLGAELNSEIEHQTACDTTVGAARPMGERGATMADTLGKAYPASPREVGRTLASGLARDLRGFTSQLQSLIEGGRRPATKWPSWPGQLRSGETIGRPGRRQ